MFDVTIIERALRDRASDSEREISQEHMALLLYWAYGWTLANRGSRLFDGGIVASEIGPMPRQWTERPRPPIAGRRKTEAASVTWVVESTWVSLARVQRPVLLSMTTGEGSAWRTVMDRHLGDVTDFPVIEDSLILTEFGRRIRRIFDARSRTTRAHLTASRSPRPDLER